MNKITLLIAAMFCMAQISAATTDVAASETTAESPVTSVAAEDANESTYQHPLIDDEESTKHWTLTSNGFYFGWGVKHENEIINNSFEIGLLNACAVKYNSLHGQVITLGVGFQHMAYNIHRHYMLVRGTGSEIVTVGTFPTDNGIKNRTSKLNLWTFQVPLMFKQKIVKGIDLSVAGIMNWNTYARVNNHYEVDKVEYETKIKNLKQNKINFDVMGSLTWNDCGIYCRFSPGKFFKDGYGPEIKNTWTLGAIFFL